MGLIVHVLLASSGRHSVTELLSLISVMLRVFLPSSVLGKGMASTAVSAVLYRFCIALHLSLVNGILPYLANLALYMEMWC